MYMKYSISNNDNKSLNNYQINNRPSSLINSHSMNRRKFNSISENNHPKNKKKFHNGSISSSLRYKKLNYNHSSQLLPFNNEFRISNDKKNINMNNTSLFPYINMNKSNSETSLFFIKFNWLCLDEFGRVTIKGNNIKNIKIVSIEKINMLAFSEISSSNITPILWFI